MDKDTTAAKDDAGVERLYSLRELEQLGYGGRKTNARRITAGLLPAVQVGNAYRVRKSDLHLLAVPVDARAA
ncbi:MAG: hypothetical protein ACTH2Q_01565 [Propionibacteriaceae bacterium]